MKYKNYIPHIAAVVIFFLISVIYFAKPLSEGKKINLPDIDNYKGSSHEIWDYQKETGKKTLWTNSMFSGMPTYQITTPPSPKLLTVIHRILNLDHIRPINFIFLYFIGFYIALLCFKIDPWVAIVGAIGYAFSSYFFIIIDAGHAAKIMALGYLPPIIGGIHLAYKGKRLLGGLIMGLFLALQIKINHPQITYYTAIIALLYAIVLFIYSFKDKKVVGFIITSAILVVFGVVAVGTNLGVLMPTLEYTDYSTRGKSDLVEDKDNQTSGLDKDYATDWSYGIGESFTVLIPNFMGGASVSELPENSETYKLYEKHGSRAAAKNAIKHQYTYWGEQPSTAGPVYIGAIICFLFVFAFFIADKKYIWWLGIATFISFILSWGKHIPGITHFLLDHLPIYNKFRAVSVGLVIAEFTMPLLAILAVNKLLKGEVPKAQAIKGLKYAVGITGGLSLFFIMFAKSLFDFNGAVDQQYLTQQGGEMIVDALKADRLMLFRKDAFRSLVYILLSAGVIYFFVIEKLKMTYALISLGALILIDMWGVNLRYLNDDDFVSKRKAKTPFAKTKADEFILQDPTLDYRVLNMAVSTFNDASTSYYHKSIGGYHGAKMQRYQELISYHISQDMQRIYTAFRSQDMTVIDKALESCSTLNMINTKYIIYNPEAAPILNRSAMGNAWFANNVKWVKNANEENEALFSFDLKKDIVIDEKFKDQFEGFSPIYDSSASIDLISYAPDELKYKSSSQTDQLAVFSEIYYPKGWHVTIDGEEVDHFRCNYVLRGLKVPAGAHEIDFKFEPETYYRAQTLAKASSIVFLLLILGVVFIEYKAIKEQKD